MKENELQKLGNALFLSDIDKLKVLIDETNVLGTCQFPVVKFEETMPWPDDYLGSQCVTLFDYNNAVEQLLTDANMSNEAHKEMRRQISSVLPEFFQANACNEAYFLKKVIYDLVYLLKSMGDNVELFCKIRTFYSSVLRKYLILAVSDVELKQHLTNEQKYSAENIQEHLERAFEILSDSVVDEMIDVSGAIKSLLEYYYEHNDMIENDTEYEEQHEHKMTDEKKDYLPWIFDATRKLFNYIIENPLEVFMISLAAQATAAAAFSKPMAPPGVAYPELPVGNIDGHVVKRSMLQLSHAYSASTILTPAWKAKTAEMTLRQQYQMERQQLRDVSARQASSEFSLGPVNAQPWAATPLQNGDYAVSYALNNNMYLMLQQNGVLGSPIRINEGGSTSQLHLVRLANGNFITGWLNRGGAYNDGLVYFQLFNAAGVKQGSNILVVNLGRNEDEASPILAAYYDQGFCMAIEKWDESGYNTYVQRFHNDGAVDGGLMRVNKITTPYRQYPNVITLPDRRALIAIRNEQPGKSAYVEGYFLAADGQTVSNIIRLSPTLRYVTTSSSVMLRPGVLLTTNTILVRTSQYHTENSLKWEEHVQAFDLQGQPISDMMSLTGPKDGQQNDWGLSSCRIASNLNLVVYVEDTANNKNVLVAMINDLGRRVSQPVMASEFADYHQDEPRCVSLGGGRFVVIWRQQLSTYSYSTQAREFCVPMLVNNAIALQGATEMTLTSNHLSVACDGEIAGNVEFTVVNQQHMTIVDANNQSVMRFTQQDILDSKLKIVADTSNESLSLTVEYTDGFFKMLDANLNVARQEFVPQNTISPTGSPVNESQMISPEFAVGPVGDYPQSVLGLGGNSYAIGYKYNNQFYLVIKSNITNNPVRLSEDGGGKENLSLARLDNGNIVASWLKLGGSYNDGLLQIQIISADGQLVNGNVLGENLGLNEDGAAPFIATYDNGGFSLVFERNEGGVYNTYVKRFHNDGSLDVDKIRVNAGSGTYRQYPNIVSLPGGRLFVAMRNEVAGKTCSLIGRFIDADMQISGNPINLTPSHRIVTTNQDCMLRPDVLLTSRNTLLVEWSQNHPESNIDYELYLQEIDLTGNLLGDPVNLTSKADGDQYDWGVGLCRLGSNMNLVAYNQNLSNDVNSMACIVDDHGAPISQPFMVSEYVTYDQEHPRCAALADDRFVVSWRQGLSTYSYNAEVREFCVPLLKNQQIDLQGAGERTLTTSQLSATCGGALDGTIEFEVVNPVRVVLKKQGVTVTRFTQQEVIDGQIKVAVDGSGEAPSLGVKLSNGLIRMYEKPVQVFRQGGQQALTETKLTTTATTTTQPATVAPTMQPTTVAPTTRPVTVAPTTQPVTVAPTTQPATGAPTTQPVTVEPTSQPVTVAPTTQPVIAVQTTRPTTVVPTTQPATVMPETTPPDDTLVNTTSPTSGAGEPSDRGAIIGLSIGMSAMLIAIITALVLLIRRCTRPIPHPLKPEKPKPELDSDPWCNNFYTQSVSESSAEKKDRQCVRDAYDGSSVQLATLSSNDDLGALKNNSHKKNNKFVEPRNADSAPSQAQNQYGMFNSRRAVEGDPWSVSESTEELYRAGRSLGSNK